jgi:hypothetical protein
VKFFRTVFGSGKEIVERLQFQILTLVDQLEAFADVLGHDLILRAVLRANLAVFHSLLFSLLLLGGEAPVIGTSQASHARLVPSLLLSNPELAQAQLRKAIAC